MMFGLEDVFTISLLVLGIIIVGGAHIYLKSTYGKSKKIKAKNRMSGCEVAKRILERNSLGNIYVVETPGELSDHYDPKRKVVRLSPDVFHGESIAALAVAAHEVGHAIQDKDGYKFMRIRAALVPVVNFASFLGFVGIFIAIFASLTGWFYLSIIAISATILFQLVTLPVEFDASKKAMRELEAAGIVYSDEFKPTKNMLNAAAMTYVAGLISNLLQLLRIIIMMRGRR